MRGQRGQGLTVHGWIYGLHDGKLRDLGLSITGETDLDTSFAAAIDALAGKRVRLPNMIAH